MESLLHLLLFFSVLLLFLLQKHRTTKKPAAHHRPPGPKGLPIIGNLHQLDNSKLYLQLWQLSKIYGPLFSLQLGSRPVIVVSSAKMAEQLSKNHDLEVSSRPLLRGQQKLSYNGLNMAFSPYSDYWREIRKITNLHIFSLKRVSSFSSIRQSEVMQMIDKISGHAASSKVTNLNEILMSLTSSIICRIAFGRSYEDEQGEKIRFKELLNESQALMASFFVSDYIPLMGWIDKVTGLLARLERNYKEIDAFYQRVINEHLDPNRPQPNEEDITDVLLQLKKQHSYYYDFTDDNIKAVIMEILVAGTDASAATLVWAMVELMKNPGAMIKAQAEIRNLCDNKGFVEEHDTHKLSYLKAVIKETFRIHPPTPLLLPRETTKDITIDGYEIPDKTLLFVNAWAIQKDPETWNDSEKFLPERFLDSATDFRGQNFELIPFGFGRRICPGLHMGVAMVELILANFLYKFNWEMPIGMTKEDIDIEVLPGLTQHKKNPLCLVAKNHF